MATGDRRLGGAGRLHPGRGVLMKFWFALLAWLTILALIAATVFA